MNQIVPIKDVIIMIVTSVIPAIIVGVLSVVILNRRKYWDHII